MSIVPLFSYTPIYRCLYRTKPFHILCIIHIFFFVYKHQAKLSSESPSGPFHVICTYPRVLSIWFGRSGPDFCLSICLGIVCFSEQTSHAGFSAACQLTLCRVGTELISRDIFCKWSNMRSRIPASEELCQHPPSHLPITASLVFSTCLLWDSEDALAKGSNAKPAQLFTLHEYP